MHVLHAATDYLTYFDVGIVKELSSVSLVLYSAWWRCLRNEVKRAEQS
jgi:hypothetical protein